VQPQHRPFADGSAGLVPGGTIRKKLKQYHVGDYPQSPQTLKPRRAVLVRARKWQDSLAGFLQAHRGFLAEEDTCRPLCFVFSGSFGLPAKHFESAAGAQGANPIPPSVSVGHTLEYHWSGRRGMTHSQHIGVQPAACAADCPQRCLCAELTW